MMAIAMDFLEKIHTAARRYCMDRHHYWCMEYQRVNPSGTVKYTDEHYDTFPRYNVLNAILVELERYTGETYPTVEAAKAAATRAGFEGNDAFTESPSNDTEKKAIEDERFQFAKHIDGLSDADLEAVEPLPYRRVLSKEESARLWTDVKKKWDIDGYWYPLAETQASQMAAFQDRHFEESVPPEKLRDILSGRGINRIWQLMEYGPEYEIDTVLFEPCYGGAEGYWTSDGFDWLVYASHESSITVAGWLLPEVQQVWPESKTHVWTTPFSDKDLE